MPALPETENTLDSVFMRAGFSMPYRSSDYVQQQGATSSYSRLAQGRSDGATVGWNQVQSFLAMAEDALRAKTRSTEQLAQQMEAIKLVLREKEAHRSQAATEDLDSGMLREQMEALLQERAVLVNTIARLEREKGFLLEERDLMCSQLALDQGEVDAEAPEWTLTRALRARLNEEHRRRAETENTQRRRLQQHRAYLAALAAAENEAGALRRRLADLQYPAAAPSPAGPLDAGEDQPGGRSPSSLSAASTAASFPHRDSPDASAAGSQELTPPESNRDKAGSGGVVRGGFGLSSFQAASPTAPCPSPPLFRGDSALETDAVVEMQSFSTPGSILRRMAAVGEGPGYSGGAKSGAPRLQLQGYELEGVVQQLRLAGYSDGSEVGCTAGNEDSPIDLYGAVSAAFPPLKSGGVATAAAASEAASTRQRAQASPLKAGRILQSPPLDVAAIAAALLV